MRDQLRIAQRELENRREEAILALKSMDPKLAELLRHEISRKPDKTDFKREFDLIERLRAEHEATPGYSDFLTLADRLKSARQAIHQLEFRREPLSGSPNTGSV